MVQLLLHTLTKRGFPASKCRKIRRLLAIVSGPMLKVSSTRFMVTEISGFPYKDSFVLVVWGAGVYVRQNSQV